MNKLLNKIVLCQRLFINMKIILTSLFMIVQLYGFPSMAQKPASIGYFRGGVNLNFSWPENGKLFCIPAFNLTPGLRIVQGSDFAMVLTMPITVGYSSDNYYHTGYAGLDVPVMLEFNFGAATGNSATSGVGFMIGAGAGYQDVGTYDNSISDYGTQKSDMDFWGYRLSFGISFGKDPTGDRTMITTSFGRSFTLDKKYTFSIGAYIILGNRKKLSER
jgi:hypothetical protein